MGRFLESDDDDLKLLAIGALRNLYKRQPNRALELVLVVDVGTNSVLADGICHIFDTSTGIPYDVFNEDQAQQILAKLEPVESIEGREVGRFLEGMSALWPREVIHMLLRRMERTETQQGYRAYPLMGLQANLGVVAQSTYGEEVLCDIRDAALRLTQPMSRLRCSELFWQIANGKRAMGLSVLDAWIHDGDEQHVWVLGALLRSAPRSLIFEHPLFVAHALEAAGRFDESDEGETSGYRYVWAMLQQTAWGHGLDQEQFAQVHRSAEEVAERWVGRSGPMYRFYSDVASSTNPSPAGQASTGRGLRP